MEHTQNLERVGNGNILTDHIEQFYVFERNHFVGPIDLPYNYRDYYKISIVKDVFTFYYAEQYTQTGENTLLFVNPQLPYSWSLNGEQTGYCCIFTEDFLNTISYIKEYPLFRDGNIAAFELSREDMAVLTNIYLRMFDELESDFIYKFDVLRTLVLELIYAALKMHPLQIKQCTDSNASQRIVNYFMDLLEKQFPIADVKQRMAIRFPAEFADHLSVHINHLNRSLKKITGETTTQMIAKRVLKEARILLSNTDWNISEIGWCLGFEDLPHFINFFKKRTKLTPKAFRQQHVEFQNSGND